MLLSAESRSQSETSVRTSDGDRCSPSGVEVEVGRDRQPGESRSSIVTDPDCDLKLEYGR